MNTIIGKDPNPEAMFNVIGGWTTQFEINGNKVGGQVDILTKDPRLMWHLKIVGGAHNKRILELGALEGAHTKMMIEAGAREVIAIEGLSDCWLRCLVVKAAFELDKAKFLFCDFCNYVANYKGEKFDFVSAAGVLYHQTNPAQLIFDLAKITDTVIVWAQVASASKPSAIESTVESSGNTYKGKKNNYNGTRLTSASYCGGLHDEAFWMYPDEMKRCFKDAGFVNIVESFSAPTINGDSILFVASKDVLYKKTYNFVHVPKVAGISFMEILKTKCPIIYKTHVPIRDIYSPYTDSMAFVRNPYDRLVSAYFYLSSGEAKTELNLVYREILKEYKDFKDFVLHIAKDNLVEKILHLKPLTYWLCDENNKVIVDKIFKIEETDSINSFIEGLGMTQKLNNYRLNISDHKNYMEYMDAEVIAEINKLYFWDFELFNYEKL